MRSLNQRKYKKSKRKTGNMRAVTTLLFFLLVANLLISCKKNSGTDIPTTSTDSFSVSVTNGYGSGKYKAGDTIFPQGRYFGKPVRCGFYGAAVEGIY